MTTGAGTEAVRIERDGDIAVILIDNPPVNALGAAVRRGLFEAFEVLDADETVAAVVLACAGRTFVAGADISEFGKPRQPPELGQVIARLETLSKPTLAALHGSALGGGLELALACRYRMAARLAKLGLPEVNLGLIPGAGGTVRLPCLVGPEKALDMIGGGAPIGAEEALTLGLVDAVAEEGELLPAAKAFLRRILTEGEPRPATRNRTDCLTIVDPEAFENQASAVIRKARGLKAPKAAVEAISNALTLPFDDALAAESALFAELASGTESHALRHLFFAERAAGKAPARTGGDAVEIRRIGVVGAGTMGGGIAMAFANAGYPVTILDRDQAAVERGLEIVTRNYATSVARGSLSQEQADARRVLISDATDYAALADADLIIEAVFEDMEAKHAVFTALDAVVRPDAVLATNTSYLDVDAIASGVSHPERVLGLHFFSPANVMKLLEVVRAGRTDPGVLAAALSTARKIGKIPVVVGVCHGFVGNRMLSARGAENEALLLEGASPEQVDRVFTDFGWPMGPFQMGDMAGLDIGWRNRKALGRTAPVADGLCERGWFGQKTGRGFYLYEPGSRTPLPNPELAEEIERLSRTAGVERRDISDREILERTLLPMIAESRKILNEGIAARASDIDLVWVHGYGFPRGKGGPMFWADHQTEIDIDARLAAWFQKTGRSHFSV